LKPLKNGRPKVPFQGKTRKKKNIKEHGLNLCADKSGGGQKTEKEDHTAQVQKEKPGSCAVCWLKGEVRTISQPSKNLESIRGSVNEGGNSKNKVFGKRNDSVVGDNGTAFGWRGRTKARVSLHDLGEVTGGVTKRKMNVREGKRGTWKREETQSGESDQEENSSSKEEGRCGKGYVRLT